MSKHRKRHRMTHTIHSTGCHWRGAEDCGKGVEGGWVLRAQEITPLFLPKLRTNYYIDRDKNVRWFRFTTKWPSRGLAPHLLLLLPLLQLPLHTSVSLGSLHKQGSLVLQNIVLVRAREESEGTDVSIS